MDDKTLVERFQNDGDRAAFEELISRYEQRIFRFGFRMCGHEQDAEDVVQDTFVSAYRNLGGFRGDASILTWLLKIASSACLKKRRLKKNEPRNHIPFEDLQSQPTGEARIDVPRQPTPDLEILSAEVRERFHVALGSIPGHYRQVLVLRELEGMSTREVAEILELTESAVKVRLHRARKMVQKAFENAGLDNSSD
jgi:RNA polymerase sigma-70 factor, ECF subfamily